MLLYLYRPLSPAEHQAAVAQFPRRSMIAEYGWNIVQKTRKAVQRSRELLDATKHLERTRALGLRLHVPAAAQSSPAPRRGR